MVMNHRQQETLVKKSPRMMVNGYRCTANAPQTFTSLDCINESLILKLKSHFEKTLQLPECLIKEQTMNIKEIR